MSYTELETGYRDLRQQTSNQQQGHEVSATASRMESSSEEGGDGIFHEVGVTSAMSRRPGFFLGNEGNVIANYLLIFNY